MPTINAVRDANTKTCLTLVPLSLAPTTNKQPLLAQMRWPKNLIHTAKKLRQNSYNNNPRILEETFGTLRRSIVLSSLKSLPGVTKYSVDDAT